MPARNATPRAVASWSTGRRTGTPLTSAWNWHRRSMTLAPPSTRSSVTRRPAARTASSTSAVCQAMASTAARTTCARVVPRVSPTRAPRAPGSHHGEPRPVSAGTNTTPPVSGTPAAIAAASPDVESRPRPSRSHCSAAPVTKIDPSSAYVVSSPSCHATVVSSPSTGSGRLVPTLVSTNDPVPYVFLVMPGSTHA